MLLPMEVVTLRETCAYADLLRLPSHAKDLRPAKLFDTPTSVLGLTCEIHEIEFSMAPEPVSPAEEYRRKV